MPANNLPELGIGGECADDLNITAGGEAFAYFRKEDVSLAAEMVFVWNAYRAGRMRLHLSPSEAGLQEQIDSMRPVVAAARALRAWSEEEDPMQLEWSRVYSGVERAVDTMDGAH